MDKFVVKQKRSNEPAAKPAKRISEEIGWARCPICDATVALSVMGQHVDSGCKEFAGAKRRKSEPALFAVPHETLGGQYIVADFLSEEEEAEILAFLDADADPPWKDCRFNGRHRGKHWGVRIDIAAGKLLEQTHAMPDVTSASFSAPPSFSTAICIKFPSFNSFAHAPTFAHFSCKIFTSASTCAEPSSFFGFT